MANLIIFADRSLEKHDQWLMTFDLRAILRWTGAILVAHSFDQFLGHILIKISNLNPWNSRLVNVRDHVNPSTIEAAMNQERENPVGPVHGEGDIESSIGATGEIHQRQLKGKTKIMRKMDETKRDRAHGSLRKIHWTTTANGPGFERKSMFSGLSERI